MVVCVSQRTSHGSSYRLYILETREREGRGGGVDFAVENAVSLCVQGRMQPGNSSVRD